MTFQMLVIDKCINEIIVYHCTFYPDMLEKELLEEIKEKQDAFVKTAKEGSYQECLSSKADFFIALASLCRYNDYRKEIKSAWRGEFREQLFKDEVRKHIVELRKKKPFK